jgi:hypothetical protein
MPCYGEILVYGFTSSLNTWIDYNDVDFYGVAASVGTKRMTGYYAMDVDLDSWSLNNDSAVIYYGTAGKNKWGEYFYISSDVNGQQYINGGFEIERKPYYGVFTALAWYNDQEIVGSAWNDLYGKTSSVDIGKGIEDKKDVPRSMKGIIEQWNDTNDIFEGFGTMTATLQSQYTKYANTGDGKSLEATLKYIVAALKKQNYAFNEYILDVNITGSGTVDKNPNRTIFHDGNSVELTATADSGWAFISWGGGIDSNDTNNPITITMVNDVNAAVLFEEER